MCVHSYVFFYNIDIKRIMATREEPAVITLNDLNSIEILSKYIEVAQQKGAYLLSEAEVLKRACDVLIHNIIDNEITSDMGKQLLIQGAVKGQRHGAYTLNDASLLNKVVQFVSNSLQKAIPQQTQEQAQAQEQAQEQTQEQTQEEILSDDNEYDLSDLAEPIPLKPKEV